MVGCVQRLLATPVKVLRITRVERKGTDCKEPSQLMNKFSEVSTSQDYYLYSKFEVNYLPTTDWAFTCLSEL